MKLRFVDILVFNCIIVFATETMIFAEQKRPVFKEEIKRIMDRVAKQNNWKWAESRNYDKAHIVPWQEIKKQVEAYGTSSGYNDLKMENFVKDLTKVHGDAAYYANLDDPTKKKYNELNSKYQKDSLKLLKEAKSGKKKALLNVLFNSPANLYPGNLGSNRRIKNNLDPPLKYLTDSSGKIQRNKEGKVLRSNEMTGHAKQMLVDYKLETLKTSDKTIYTSDGKGNDKTRKNQEDPKKSCTKRKKRSLSGCGAINDLEETKKKKTNTKTKTKTTATDSRRKGTDSVRRIGVTKKIVARSKKIIESVRRGASKIRRTIHRITTSRYRSKGKRGGRGKGIKSGMIDFTDGWVPKNHKTKVTGQKFEAESGSSKVNDRLKWEATSGGYEGEAKHGLSKASGTAHIGFEAVFDPDEAHVKINAPSGEASSHGFGVGGDLSVKAGITMKDKVLKVGIDGPSVSGNVGPIGAGYGIGAGADSSLNFKKGAGARVDTPVGSFGAKVGCITEVCYFGCLTLKFC